MLLSADERLSHAKLSNGKLHMELTFCLCGLSPSHAVLWASWRILCEKGNLLEKFPISMFSKMLSRICSAFWNQLMYISQCTAIRKHYQTQNLQQDFFWNYHHAGLGAQAYKFDLVCFYVLTLEITGEGNSWAPGGIDWACRCLPRMWVMAQNQNSCLSL